MITVRINAPKKKSYFLEELKTTLVGYLAPTYDHFFVSCGSEYLKIDEIFHEEGMLPIFIYDKNPFIIFFLEQFNKEHGTHFEAKFSLVDDNSALTAFRVDFEHNIPVKEISNNDELAYIAFHGLKRYLSYLILSSKFLTIKNNVLSIDNLYYLYVDSFKNKEETIIEVCNN